MPDWRRELETLLSQLEVSLDSAHESSPNEMPSPVASLGTSGTLDGSADVPWELVTHAPEEPPADGVEVSAVRSEIEATLERVIYMTQQGRLERALRDDVIFVLQALTRSHPTFSSGGRAQSRRNAEAYQEWSLALAAAVLRFCRVVQRLTDILTRTEDA